MHKNALVELVHKLKTIGEEIKDELISPLLLCSVTNRYENLITTLKAIPEGELTPEFIKRKLTDECNRKIDASTSELHLRCFPKCYKKCKNCVHIVTEIFVLNQNNR